MLNFTPDTTYDFQLLTATQDGSAVSILLRTKDGFVSKSSPTGEAVDRMVSNYQRIIDGIVFASSDETYNDVTVVIGFNYYSPDYVPLESVTVL